MDEKRRHMLTFYKILREYRGQLITQAGYRNWFGDLRDEFLQHQTHRDLTEIEDALPSEFRAIFLGLHKYGVFLNRDWESLLEDFIVAYSSHLFDDLREGISEELEMQDA